MPDCCCADAVAMKKAFRILLLCLGMALGLQQADASAWNQAPGHGQIILTTSFYRTGSSFDQNGNSQPFGYVGDFRQLLTAAYGEIGLNRRDALIFNIPGEFLRFSNQYGASEAQSAGDVELAWKHRLSRLKSPLAWSAQVLVMFPAYSATINPAPGNHQQDIEARMLLGRGRELGKGSKPRPNFFWDIEAAYRYRSGAPADQFRGDATLGVDLPHAHLMLLGQLFTITSLQNGSPLSLTSNPNAQSDFDLYKVQPSLVVHLGKRTSMQGGWNTAFRGRNTGTGQTVIFAIWKTF